jgi:hypothetical protein
VLPICNLTDRNFRHYQFDQALFRLVEIPYLKGTTQKKGASGCRQKCHDHHIFCNDDISRLYNALSLNSMNYIHETDSDGVLSLFLMQRRAEGIHMT